MPLVYTGPSPEGGCHTTILTESRPADHTLRCHNWWREEGKRLAYRSHFSAKRHTQASHLVTCPRAATSTELSNHRHSPASHALASQPTASADKQSVARASELLSQASSGKSKV